MKRKQPVSKLRPTPLLLLLLLVVMSCGDKPKSNFSGDYVIPKTETFEATTFENTQRVSSEVLNHLDGYDENTGTYTFSGSPSMIESLKTGTVVLFEAHSLRKIKAIRKENGKTIVESDPAMLTEYFKDATIQYEAPISWTRPEVAASKVTFGQPIATIAMPLMATLGDEGLGVKFERELKGWKVTFELKPEAGEKLNIELTAEKQHVCRIKAEGYISSLTSNASIVIENGTTQQFSYRNDGLEGEIELKFAAVGLGSEIAYLEIPAQIERTILVEGFIPVTLRLKANLKIFPEVAAGSSSQVSMKLAYNSNLGFSYQTGRVQPSGGMSSENAEQTGDCNTATAGIAGMGVGIEFPRFEIGILGNVVVPYLVLNTHTSSYLSTGLLDNRPCHEAKIKYDAHAGVSMRFLGVLSINNDYKLFENEKKWVAQGSHCGD